MHERYYIQPAHREETEKLRKKNRGSTIAEDADTVAEQQPLSIIDALAILNVNSPPSIQVPLTGSLKDDAKTNFDRFFASAEHVQNPYLQGKISGAYRVLVDPQWDSNVSDSASIPK